MDRKWLIWVAKGDKIPMPEFCQMVRSPELIEELKRILDWTAELVGMSNPGLRKVEGMVYEIWSDGEITLQKCGSLYGQRSLHMIVPGLGVSVVEMPDKRPGQFGCMAVHVRDLVRARELICLIAGIEDRSKMLVPRV